MKEFPFRRRVATTSLSTPHLGHVRSILLRTARQFPTPRLAASPLPPDLGAQRKGRKLPPRDSALAAGGPFPLQEAPLSLLPGYHLRGDGSKDVEHLARLEVEATSSVVVVGAVAGGRRRRSRRWARRRRLLGFAGFELQGGGGVRGPGELLDPARPSLAAGLLEGVPWRAVLCGGGGVERREVTGRFRLFSRGASAPDSRHHRAHRNRRLLVPLHRASTSG